MNTLLDHAMTVAARLSDESQSILARHIMDEAKRLAILEGIAAADAGLLIPHEEVKAWLESWGTDHELPRPGAGDPRITPQTWIASPRRVSR